MKKRVRTTITLDDDVAAKLKSEVRRSGAPFKQVVNDVLRRGLHQPSEKASLAPFRVSARSLGEYPGMDYDNIGKLLEQAEGPAHK